METNELETDKFKCPSCGNEVKSEDTFCGLCGKEINILEDPPAQEDVFTTLQPTLLFYFTTLMLFATYKFTSVFRDDLEGMLWVTLLDILIVIAFWLSNFQDIKPLFSLSNLKFKIIVLTILGAIAGSVIVSMVANFINLSIHDDVFYNTYLFEGTSFPFLFATLLIAVQPAIFEEVAFRGFLFNNLKQISGGASAVYISGFLFGIMHLQIISLLWLIPIGLVFGFLRNRYQTLWYGVIGHFTYNFFITIYEFIGWF